MIQINKPFLPPKEEYLQYIDEIYKSYLLTNHGPLLIKFENRLKDKLGIKALKFVGNGTIALQIAIRTLELNGEIITTPFSYIATLSSIVWENCIPVFADIEIDSFNIDPSEIEKKISSKTCAILATHVFGNPCNIDAISNLANKYNLRVIYDGAHSFGVEYNGKSIFSYGDISITSFHATKLLHTVEGGALFSNDSQLIEKAFLHHNFGHTSPYSFKYVGVNGKNSEFHAAMGLCNLKYVDDILKKRESDYRLYKHILKNETFSFQKIYKGTKYNYAYFPLVFENKKELISKIELLHENSIFPRRYFYPSLNKIHYVRAQKCKNSENISSRILCLPLFYDLSQKEIIKICELLKIRNF